jgi:hypothetical protein
VLKAKRYLDLSVVGDQKKRLKAGTVFGADALDIGCTPKHCLTQLFATISCVNIVAMFPAILRHVCESQQKLSAISHSARACRTLWSR